MKKLLISILAITIINTAYAEGNFFDIFRNDKSTEENVVEVTPIEVEMQQRWEKIKDLEEKLSYDKNKENLKANHDIYAEEFAIYLDYLSQDSEKVFELGDYYFKQGRYEKAYEIFSNDNTNVKNIFGAATTARFLNDKTNALKLYNLALEKDPNLYEAYLGRGIVERDRGEYEEAIKDFYKYMDYTDNESAYLGLGDIYMKTNRTFEAKNILESGRKKFPNSILIKEMLLKAYAKLK